MWLDQLDLRPLPRPLPNEGTILLNDNGIKIIQKHKRN